MQLERRLPHQRAAELGLCSVVAMSALVGCRSYEPAPLEIEDHRASLDARLIETEPISAFAERLRASGAEAPEVFDPSDGLTPPEGEVLSLFYNADLRLARLEAGVALASFEHAGLWEDPVFRFNGAEIVSPSSPFEFGLTVSLTIPISGRLAVEKTRAGAAYERELRRIVDAEWSTRADVRRAWAAWSSAQERARMQQEVVAQIERIESITARLETAGELTRVEGRLFRVELVVRRAALAKSELQVLEARLDLLGLMGLSPAEEVALAPAYPAYDAPVFEDAIARLIEANTELAVRRAAYVVAEESLRLEIRKQYPDITIGSGYGSENNDDRLLLGASIPIPLLNANRAGIAEAHAQREVARATAETTFERLARELAAAEASLEGARTQRTHFEQEIIPMLAEQFAEIEKIVELGEVDTFLLLETVKRQFEAKSRLLDLRLVELDASITILQLLGPNEPGEPAPRSVVADNQDPAPAVDDPSAEGGAP